MNVEHGEENVQVKLHAYVQDEWIEFKWRICSTLFSTQGKTFFKETCAPHSYSPVQ